MSQVLKRKKNIKKITKSLGSIRKLLILVAMFPALSVYILDRLAHIKKKSPKPHSKRVKRRYFLNKLILNQDAYDMIIIA
jgi:hypothetical protein